MTTKHYSKESRLQAARLARRHAALGYQTPNAVEARQRRELQVA